MPKLYHSVPLDEEQHLNEPVSEKSVWTSRFDGRVSSTLEKIPRHWTWLVHAVLLSASITLFTLSVCTRTASQITDKVVAEKYSSYSPAASAVRYETQKFNLTPIMKTEYVGYGPDVDAAWDVIANDIGDIMITEEERVKLGFSPKSLKIQHPVTGQWGYRAGVEVFHQLHCLNLLRQAIYKDYYSKEEVGGDVAEADGQEDLSGHVDHCIETLRLNLMCQSDIGVFTFHDFPELADDGIEGDWPDFETQHVCRNFEAIRKWTNANAVAFTHDV
ncbi:hypothetical protein DL546_003356 [Coniochaeta pulveracea]|uniref:Cyclochlorotine biosynthesis protein O n=1 Tax=Coniochaeta pulveracea TaxID=177199 RepID=A0A420Y1R8_9PEZI|nr:hypothetical protein DL546_003356 [Coniochaeta pulveracea]